MRIAQRLRRAALRPAWLLSLAGLGAPVGVCAAQASTTITIASSPPLISVTNASTVAGSQPSPVLSATTTYSATVQILQSNYRISAALSSALPAGVSVRVKMVAPSSGTSTGFQTLSTSSVNLVTGIAAGTYSSTSQTIQYEVTGTVSAGVLTTVSRTVTFTIGP